MYSYSTRYKHHKAKPMIIILSIIMILAIIIFSYFRIALAFPVALGTVAIDDDAVSFNKEMSWPPYGQSAVGVNGYGVIASNNSTKPAPFASVTKLVTALVVLKEKPMDDPSQKIKFSPEDVELYNQYVVKQGVAVEITPDQELTYQQVMQYTLILSANNMADKLVHWAYGSMENYLEQANQYLKDNNLNDTKVADASGFSPQSVSPAEDLIKLGELSLSNKVIAETVAQDYVNLPNGEQRINTNPFLNFENNGVIGIKNGLTDEAGGVLLAAAKRSINGNELIMISAVMGSEKFFDSQKDAVALFEPLTKILSSPAKLDKGSKIGHYSLPWGEEVDIVTKEDIQVDSWSKIVDRSIVEIYPLESSRQAGESVGIINIKNQKNELSSNVDLVLTSDIVQPSIYWRLKNPIR